MEGPSDNGRVSPDVQELLLRVATRLDSMRTCLTELEPHQQANGDYRKKYGKHPFLAVTTYLAIQMEMPMISFDADLAVQTPANPARERDFVD